MSLHWQLGEQLRFSISLHTAAPSQCQWPGISTEAVDSSSTLQKALPLKPDGFMKQGSPVGTRGNTVLNMGPVHFPGSLGLKDSQDTMRGTEKTGHQLVVNSLCNLLFVALNPMTDHGQGLGPGG